MKRRNLKVVAIAALVGVLLEANANGIQQAATPKVVIRIRSPNRSIFSPSISKLGMKYSTVVAITIVIIKAKISVSAFTRHQNQRAISTVPSPAKNTEINLNAPRMLGISVVAIIAAIMMTTIVILAIET